MRVRVRIPVRVRVCVFVCVRAFDCVCVRAFVCVRMRLAPSVQNLWSYEQNSGRFFYVLWGWARE